MRKLFVVCAMLLASTMLFAQQATVSLAWTPNAATDQITKYVVFEKIGAAYNQLAEVLPTACTATECTVALPDVQAGVHTYVVAAENMWGRSGYSNEASSPPAPGVPANITIKIEIVIR